MRKIINTFKYGSAQTKHVLVLCLFSGAATAGLAVSALIFRQLLLFFGMVIGVFVTLSLVQTFQIRKGDEPETDISSGEKREKVKPGKAKKEKKENSRNRKNFTGKTEHEAEPDEKFVREASGESTVTGASAEPAEEPAVEPASEEVLQTYDRRKIKKTCRKYKVKRDHRMVLIDHCKKLDIFQTPAYIWVHDKEFHILLIEKEPRHITIPLYKLREISYLKKQPANTDVDYAVFQKNSMIAELFRPYLPDYTHSTVVDDLSVYKNLYGVGPDIYFTNRSAASLFDLLGADFRVDDKVTMSRKVNIFFKEAYKSNILLRDNVIDANGYADRISNTLDSMARAAISHAEFKDTLNLMIKNKLITQEFAMYYMGVRDKISR